MGRTWAFCLEPDHAGNNGNFSGNSNPPNRGVFWVTGDVTAVAPFTFSSVTFFDADDAPTLYDGDQMFYAISRFNLPGGQSIQDILVAFGRIRNTPTPATVGSPIKLGSGAGARPKCIVSKDTVAGGLTTVILPLPGGGTTTLDAIGPIIVNKDPGGNRPKKSKYETLIIARVGIAPNNISAEFAFDPEVDVDNGL